MRVVPAMVDMARTPAEKKEAAKEMATGPAAPMVPDYPYGLCISLDNDSLEKLALDAAEVSVGDMLHMHCMATVRSVSQTDGADGPCCRVELQITAIAAEDEDAENAEDEAAEAQPASVRRSKLYG